ncbi:uncharacterized protein LOC131606108 [Vicia villosa]|uniref:uncharacterized protein LOC131606108 n=1 Tax=Vicia villosa TaxID=3911 RepID=UPI00273C6B2E|nr:uncharacterized protein LOC131606108 [Vicia villosa]XP_058734372.1 uncharacterized protein LOC131606108 [Vicia villosa]XP_058734373.1 uncharacterized protein LOC131606108 [Vicia villosa]
MFSSRARWLRFVVQFKLFPTTSVCNNSAQRSSFCTSAKNSNNNSKEIITDERYRQLENLDMMTAIKILFTDPPKKKKFGFDFHLVQFFFACMPSLAVYLVAQYARYEIRTMEVEVEQKRKKKEEEEAKEREKELELNPPEEKEANPQLSEVNERLDKLEETVKEIAVVTKKQSSSNIVTNQVTGDEKEPLNNSAPRNTSEGKDNSKSESGEESKGSVATSNSSLQNPTGQNQSGRAS